MDIENALDFVINFTLHMEASNWDNRLSDDTSQAFVNLADDFLKLVRFTGFDSLNASNWQVLSPYSLETHL